MKKIKTFLHAEFLFGLFCDVSVAKADDGECLVLYTAQEAGKLGVLPYTPEQAGRIAKRALKTCPVLSATMCAAAAYAEYLNNKRHEDK